MARINIVICDLCKLTMDDGGYEISLVLHSTESSRGEICYSCFHNLLGQLTAKPDAAKLKDLKNDVCAEAPIKINQENKEDLAGPNGETVIPSIANLVEREITSCSHDKRTMNEDSGKAVCIKCGDLWEDKKNG